MMDPTRWLDPTSDASPGVRDLLSAAAKAPVMTDAVRAASVARVAGLTTGAATMTGFGKVMWGLAVVAAGATGMLALRLISHDPASSRLAPPPPSVVPFLPVVPTAPPIMVVPASPAVAVVHTPVLTTPSATASTPVARPRVAPPVAPAVSEEALLERARQLLDTDAPSALNVLQQHARLYPHGQYVEEREYLVFRAQARQHAVAAMRSSGTRYLAAHPHGLYAAQVRRALEGGP